MRSEKQHKTVVSDILDLMVEGQIWCCITEVKTCITLSLAGHCCTAENCPLKQQPIRSEVMGSSMETMKLGTWTHGQICIGDLHDPAHSCLAHFKNQGEILSLNSQPK